MKPNKIADDVIRRGQEMQKIGNRAVRKAQEENRRLGLPNVYSQNGKIFYELPDGTITNDSPWKNDATEKSKQSKPPPISDNAAS